MHNILNKTHSSLKLHEFKLRWFVGVCERQDELVSRNKEFVNRMLKGFSCFDVVVVFISNFYLLTTKPVLSQQHIWLLPDQHDHKSERQKLVVHTQTSLPMRFFVPAVMSVEGRFTTRTHWPCWVVYDLKVETWRHRRDITRTSPTMTGATVEHKDEC